MFRLLSFRTFTVGCAELFISVSRTTQCKYIHTTPPRTACRRVVKVNNRFGKSPTNIHIDVTHDGIQPSCVWMCHAMQMRNDIRNVMLLSRSNEIWQRVTLIRQGNNIEAAARTPCNATIIIATTGTIDDENRTMRPMKIIVLLLSSSSAGIYCNRQHTRHKSAWVQRATPKMLHIFRPFAHSTPFTELSNLHSIEEDVPLVRSVHFVCVRSCTRCIEPQPWAVRNRGRCWFCSEEASYETLITSMNRLPKILFNFSIINWMYMFVYFWIFLTLNEYELIGMSNGRCDQQRLQES